MTDLYKTMTDAAEAERKAGDVMIEARRVYYARLDALAIGTEIIDPATSELNDAYEAAHAAWEQAHKAAGGALLAWLKTVR